MVLTKKQRKIIGIKALLKSPKVGKPQKAGLRKALRKLQ